MNHVVITGAAGAIGSAIARVFYRSNCGVRLTLIDLDEARLADAARKLGGDLACIAHDLADTASLPDLVRRIALERGPIDVLVNCAGVMEVRAFEATDWALAARLLEIDFTSPMRLMSLVAPAMVARRSGVIVNVSSMAGITPLRGCAYYGAAKAGLAMASEVARLDLAPHGVHVVTVYPGPVRSELEQRARAQAGDSWVARLVPTGDAEPLAERILWACAHRRPRVVFPSFYEIASRFPVLAGAVTRAISPAPP